ncbi:MAG TPA: dihydrofolate synthase [Candidatus Agrococcus pullicola]|uniref:tetrahydrofolate synthase n=1 Tax=Candidatus Agrococcus pullicola TaxID=2838429 RepID=A0A9D1YWL0_9MICO|nr:dihydrofolate synthase [Candidatus Agrococcus pullicola]
MSDDVDDLILDSLEDREAAEHAYRELLERAAEQAIEPRLHATARAVELLGDPQNSARVIHITGTNGKGSTARIVEALLRAHGLRTGMLTSPHLERVNERIVVDGQPVSDEAFARNWEDVKPFIELVDAQLEGKGERKLTFFEAFTVLAFAIFADAPVDVQILEVGMGGEWDSTNVAHADVAVFTPIALDHMNRLGSTIAAITATKAGILKPGSLAVSAAQEPLARGALDERAAELGITVQYEGESFRLDNTQIAVGGQMVSLTTAAKRHDDTALPLMGMHQSRNAALAVAAVEAFLGGGEQGIAEDVLADGFALATSPGRLEVIGNDPVVVVDAAHNPHAAAALVEGVQGWFGAERAQFVLGLLRGKDARGVLETLAPLVDTIVITESDSDRAMPAEDLARIAGEVLGEDAVILEPHLLEAVEIARERADDREHPVVVTGSITLLGDVMRFAREEMWIRS